MNLLVGQSGGPTAAINASLAGVIKAGIDSKEIGKVYGTVNGIDGVLNDELVDLEKFRDEKLLKLLIQTPSSYLGSCRHKLPNLDEGRETYEKIEEIFKKYDIGYFLYIGGNDSMDTVDKLSRYFAEKKSDIRVVGVPKTIDNDLCQTDHTPGFGSAAKFVANTARQLAFDTKVYGTTKSVIVLEIMGRNAGWLTAAASLANNENIKAVDAVCLPETVFDKEKFLSKVDGVMKEKNFSIIAVSEGIKDSEGNYIGENKTATRKDGFAHAALGGVGKTVESWISQGLGLKTRSIELSTLQRCFSAGASKCDLDEAFEAGHKGVELALKGETAIMIGFNRISDEPYKIDIVPYKVSEIANGEKTIPMDMISPDGMEMNENFIKYARPLICGEPDISYTDGTIDFVTR